MNKKLKKTIIIAAVAVAVCGAVWGGLTIARNAQRGDVNVYAVSDFSMTDYWGDTSNTSGSVTTDNLQKIYLSSTQTVSKVYVTEGEQVKKGMKLISYDTTLSETEVERARIQYDRQAGQLQEAKDDLKLLQKAKRKEELEPELDKLKKQLEEEKAKYDKQTGYNSNDPVTEQLLDTKTLKDKNGQEYKVYYYAWPSTSELTGEHLLSGFGGRLRVSETTPVLETNIVLVQRSGDKVGGYIQANWGVRVTENYRQVSATAYEITQDVQLVTNLPEYKDPGHTYNSETIKKLEQKVEQQQKRKMSSM